LTADHLLAKKRLRNFLTFFSKKFLGDFNGFNYKEVESRSEGENSPRNENQKANRPIGFASEC